MSLELHAILAIVLTLGALVLFSRDKIPLEYSSAAVLVTAVVVFEIFPFVGATPLRGRDFLQGFGNEALITICLLLILAKGVEISGALRPVGVFLIRIWLSNRFVALLVTLVIMAMISAFANNTPIVVMMLPILIGVAHRSGISPSRMLMPVGFATIIGGMSTTIGTSTNLLVVSLSEQYGLERLQMFDFFVPAAIAAAFGILYLWLVAPHLLPDRPSMLAGSTPRIFESDIAITTTSPLAGQTLASVVRKLDDQVRVMRVERGRALELVRLPSLVLQEGDKLHIKGTPESIRDAQESFSGNSPQAGVTRAPDERLVEVVVTRDSKLHGIRLSEARQNALRSLFPIGWHRPGQSKITPLSRTSDPLLQTGDVLLMQGPREDIQALIDTPQMLILARTIHVPRTHRAIFAMAVMFGVIAVAALNILPISATALCGVGLMLAGRCLTWNEAWRAIDTRLALIIVTSLALGTTLAATGAAGFLAHAVLLIVSDLPPALVLSALLLTTALLTELVTNNAVAVIVTPIAMSIAAELSLPALPFVLAVLFGANMSYLTPIGYQTNLLVMSAGGYRFSDFFRAGLPLQLIMWLAFSITLPALYL